ncbi:PAS domain-containing protein [Desulfobacterales bacterium HSG2]|nr:PAS domain-containing protein [Desulfobacterales bacterium HSG2]
MMDDLQDGRLRVLIADKERVMLNFYREMLSSSFDLVVCHHEEQAVKFVETAFKESRPFAVAFIDIQMQLETEGSGTAENIRKLDPFIEIVIITDGCDISPEKNACCIFPDNLLYLQKPFNAYEIQQFAFSLGMKWRENRRLRQTLRESEKQVERQSADLAELNETLKKEIAGRGRTEAVLRECRELFYSFMRHLSGTAFIKNQNGCYVYVNDAYKKAFKVGPADHIGKTDDEIWPPDVAEQLKANDRIVMSERKAINTLETVKIEEEVRHCLVSKFPIFKNGKPPFIAGIGTNVTDRIQAEKNRRMLADKIRSALNTIIDTCDILIKSAGDSGQREYLESISASARSVRVVIREILDASKAEADELDFEKILPLTEAFEAKVPETVKVPEPETVKVPEPEIAKVPEPETEKSAVSSEQEQILPNSLPGLNILEAVERLGGAWKLYKDLFLFFCKDKKNFGREFRELIKKEDFETALINAHALKGSAATISATELAMAAKALEEICNTKNRDGILELLGPVEDSLARVITYEKEISQESADVTKSSETGKDAPDLSELPDLFRKLEKSLKESDPMESENYLSEIETALTPDCSANSETEILLGELLLQTSTYNFDDAVETLDRLARKMNISLDAES